MAKNNKFTNTFTPHESPKTSRPQPNVKKYNSSDYEQAGGIIMVVFAIFLFVAFISHLLYGRSDQSLLQSMPDGSIQATPNIVKNWMGGIGAWFGDLFINKYFGVSSFGIVLLIAVAGLTLLKKKMPFSIEKFTIFSIFYTIWISLFTGYFIFNFDLGNSFDQICGGIGYGINQAMKPLFGWYFVVLLLAVFMVFLIFGHGFTSIDDDVFAYFGYKSKKTTPPSPAAEEYTEEEPAKPKNVKVKSEPVFEIDVDSIPFTVVDTETPPIQELLPFEDANIKPIKPSDIGLEIEPTLEEKMAPIAESKDETEGEDQNKSYFDEEEKDNELVAKYGLYDAKLDLGTYRYPSIELLTDYNQEKSKVTTEELEENKKKIVKTLENFDISIDKIKATVGPTVTLYEIEPSAGVRISKIKNLEDDIALNLKALGIRIIAPMPGQGTVGIEVPNKNREMVSIKSVIGSEKFQNSTYELPIVLGKTISNEIFMTDLAKMPHLLMAGATGQGKSVGLNVILASLLFKKHPAEVKFVLVDPKKVELTLYNKIERHFLATLPNAAESIITDTKKVVYTLNSLCIEMDARYDLLKDAGVRNIKEYNQKFEIRRLNPEKGHRYLPYIVLVIDELADLMMTAGKEVEGPIARLAQLARAIGIHLIVATQRPSVNVITGLIKANFPARLSFKVTSKIDSRTILDTGGADQLIGYGDMLLSSGSDIIRLQCAFADTPEIENVCEFIGSQRGYDTAYLLPEFQGDESGTDETGDFDASELDGHFADAARVVVINQQGSASLIQRKLKLGYNRAGRIIDQLEHYGIVGPFEGSKAREVRVLGLDELEALLKKILGH